jgi:hypothetical protein
LSGHITDPVIIGALRHLAEQDGGTLKPEAVVDAARDPESPLHERFTWDDTKAAQEYRLWEARRLIRVCVEYLPGDKSEEPCPVFVSLTDDRAMGAGYRTLVDVMDDDELRERLLADALKELDGFRQRYDRVKELATVFLAIDRTRRKLKIS